MQKIIKLKISRYGVYRKTPSIDFLCGEGARDYFELPADAKKVEIVLSTTPIKNSYRIRTVYPQNIRLKLSNGREPVEILFKAFQLEIEDLLQRSSGFFLYFALDYWE